jgi:hypothetical protein
MGLPVQLRVDKFRTSLRNLHGPPGVERAPQGEGWRRNLTSAATHRNDGFREVTSRKIHNDYRARQGSPTESTGKCHQEKCVTVAINSITRPSSHRHALSVHASSLLPRRNSIFPFGRSRRENATMGDDDGRNRNRHDVTRIASESGHPKKLTSLVFINGL